MANEILAAITSSYLPNPRLIKWSSLSMRQFINNVKSLSKTPGHTY